MCAMAKKHVFNSTSCGSEGTVAGMGWKTYALCVGVLVFFFLLCDKIYLFGSFFKLAYNVRGTQNFGLFLYCHFGLYTHFGRITQLFA